MPRSLRPQPPVPLDPDLVREMALALHCSRRQAKSAAISCAMLPILRQMTVDLLTECGRRGITVTLAEGRRETKENAP